MNLSHFSFLVVLLLELKISRGQVRPAISSVNSDLDQDIIQAWEEAASGQVKNAVTFTSGDPNPSMVLPAEESGSGPLTVSPGQERHEGAISAQTNETDCKCVPYMLCDVDTGNVRKHGEVPYLIDMRSYNPCRVLEICCKKILPQPKQPAKVSAAQHKMCGLRHEGGLDFRILGGKSGETQFGEFPWIAAILTQQRSDSLSSYLICEGSLVHPKVVVTAAHCLNGRRPEAMKVRLGEWDTQTTNEPYPFQERNISEVIIHEDYYPPAGFNDIALLILSTEVSFAPHIDTICLPPRDVSFDGSRCFAAGWGRTSFANESEYQVILKKVDLPVVPSDKCQRALRTTQLGTGFKLHSSFVCAGGEKGKDTCRGDGGAPLVCRMAGSEHYAQLGIVSWGIGCGMDGIPAVYTDVRMFVKWIDQKMALLNFSTSYYKDFKTNSDNEQERY